MPYINQALPVSSDAPGSDTLEANGVKHIIVNGKGRPNGDAKKNDEEDGETKKIDEDDEPCDPGMKSGLKHFYSGKEDKKGRFQWQEEMPKDVGDPAENEKTAKWALLVRNVKVYNDPRRVLSMHSIVVQSPLLKKLLAGVLKNYPGVTVGLNRLEFCGKFEPLIHRWYGILLSLAPTHRLMFWTGLNCKTPLPISVEKRKSSAQQKYMQSYCRVF